MSPLGLYAAVTLLVLTSGLAGWALLAAVGREPWSWTAPALGLAALVVIGFAAQLPGGDVTVAVLVAAALIAAVARLWRARPRPGPGVGTWPLVAVLVVAAASIPFAAGGGFDVMGTYVNNDLAFHLYNAE